jgi:PAS domain-containing protein
MHRDAPRWSQRARLVAGAVALLALLAPLVVVLGVAPRTGTAQAIGDLTILGAVALAFAGCVRAARRGGASRRAWSALAVAVGIWGAGQVAWTTYGLTRDHMYPFPSVADLGYVGYSLPAIIALLLFPRATIRTGSRLRIAARRVRDRRRGAVHELGTVLGPLYSAGGSGLPRLVGLAYPIADVTVASLVLALGARVDAGQRRPWLLLGSGLVVLTVTDSSYVAHTLAGGTGTTGSPLALGWVTAFLLIAASSAIPSGDVGGKVRHFTVLQELLPALPLLAAAAVAAGARFDPGNTLLLVNGVLLLLLAVAQQVVIAREKVELANGLEDTIARRTAELPPQTRVSGPLVQSSDDAIISKSPEGVILSWERGCRAVAGLHRAGDDRAPVDLVIPADRQDEEQEIRRLASSGGSSAATSRPSAGARTARSCRLPYVLPHLRRRSRRRRLGHRPRHQRAPAARAGAGVGTHGGGGRFARASPTSWPR